jgi:sugar phosphate isomerase/epimerase
MPPMIRSAVTISLVPEAQGGPFVFWDDLPAAVEKAKTLGFDAVEVFAPGPESFPALKLGQLLKNAGLRLAAVGTGAGWVRHQLSLTSPDAGVRRKAIEFVRNIIDWGAAAGIEAAGPGAGAPAIIGSMQGRWIPDVGRDVATGWLREALNELGPHAEKRSTRLIYEPLNRYETNFATTLAEGSEILRSLTTKNVRLLADLFHMNIEEADSAKALVTAGDDVGHVHFVDSNRRPAGNGHIDYPPIAAALQRIKFDGYASAEARPWPNPETAAEQTIRVFRRVFGE